MFKTNTHYNTLIHSGLYKRGEQEERERGIEDREDKNKGTGKKAGSRRKSRRRRRNVED